jgi:SAM-dependent methyltransferase/uncharacterized protein YbaR (Trm112 family)
MASSPLTKCVCPLTHQELIATPLEVARSRIARGEPLATRVTHGHLSKPTGETATLMMRADDRAAYPLVDGVPILLAPEVLTDPRDPASFDLVTSHYAEAYNETPFYDEEAAGKADHIVSAASLADIPSDGLRRIGQISRLSADERADFPNPPLRWLAAAMDLGSEWDCYRHLAPVQNKHILQAGGSGGIAMILLLAGAADAVLLTPMLGEARLALKLAEALGLSDRFSCVVGIAEEIPLPTKSLDIVFSGGCVHHMATELAFPEIARVLRPGGKFAALEPWRAPLYSLGTRVFGKRESNPFCRPLTRERVAPLFDAFSSARYVQHGSLTRYPMLAIQKLGARIPLDTAWTVGRIDDRICSLIPAMRRFGSGVALLATA